MQNTWEKELSSVYVVVFWASMISLCCALASTQVVRAIMLFNRKGQNSHHHSSKTVWDIKMSFGTFDYVVEMTTWKKFGVAPPKGGGPTIGWNIRFLWCFLFFVFFFIRFFQRATGQHTHCDHANFDSEHVFWCKEVPLRGLNDREPFLGFQGQKNPKIFSRDRDFPC